MQVPAPVEYERARSVDEAIALLERYGPDARLIAGGHSLIPMMKLRLARPEVVIDINDLSELAYVRREGDELRIGATARHRHLLESPVAFEYYPIFRDAERVIADPIVRNRGTVGGSICQADPSEDLSAAFAAVGAVMVIRSSAGERLVPDADFHRGAYTTAVGDGEMLVEVREGRATGRRLGGGSRGGLPHARRRHDRRGRGRARRRERRALPVRGSRVTARGRTRDRGAVRRRRLGCSGQLQPGRGPARPGRLQATSRG